MSKLRAIRGMNDLLPAQTAMWQYLEQTAVKLFNSYGYSEIRFPVLEQTELFKRSIGEVTDIVEKEMYSFDDRNGDSMTMRPEGTACCVRAAEQAGMLKNQVQRLWYMGPMFRYERPQKGRQRQFHQMGIECFGLHGPDIDAEILLLCARLWKSLGLEHAVQLELNSLGSAEDRAKYREALVSFLQERKDQLDEDSQRRLDSNPMRILDSKNPDTQALLDGAPSLLDYLGEEAQAHFARLRELLDAAGLAYTVNPRLVRGLDYYNNTVFEWTTDKLGAQGTVCAGGRYDGLASQLGGADTPAVGFGLGIERLCLLFEAEGKVPEALGEHTQVYFVVGSDRVLAQAMITAEQFRDALPNLGLLLHSGGGSFKSQLKKADKSGAAVALILGDDEATTGNITLKSLRGQEFGQQTLAINEAITILPTLLQHGAD